MDNRIEYIITEADVGAYGVIGGYRELGIEQCPCCGHREKVIVDFSPLGRVQKCDVGKKMVRINGTWYVENWEQFQKRIAERTIVTIPK